MNFLAVLVFVLGFSMVLALPIQAATEEPTPVVTTTTTATTDTTTVVNKDVPSSWGMFWRDIREKIELALSLDPVKKAEKQLTFAEERLKLAESILANSTDEKIKEKAKQMIEKANEYLAKMQEKKAKWDLKKDEKAEKLKEKLAEHISNRERLMNKLETLVSPEKIKELSDLREKGLEKEKEILGALNNENLPEKIKTKLEDLKVRIETHTADIKSFNETKKDLLEKVQAGDEQAREELKKLMESKRQEKEDRWDGQDKPGENGKANNKGNGKANKNPNQVDD